MDSRNQSTHPSLLLVNEIEILFAQVRLIELYVKQAQATAANETAKARERFQAELTALQEELKQKELALETHQALSHQVDQKLQAEIEELRAQLVASQRLQEARTTELDAARSDTKALRERILQLESTVKPAPSTAQIEVARDREALQTELAALNRELERKESALQVLQNSVKEVEDKLRSQIQDLRTQLDARAEILAERENELQNARTETANLCQHIQELELTNLEAKANVSEATRAREILQAELVSLRTAFEQKDLSLQKSHAAARELEEHLAAQLCDLQNQLAEKQGLLETRSQEISELTARTNDLQEQITCLELTNRQTVKEAQAAARALEDGLQARFREIEAAVSEKAQLLQDRTAELESAQSETALLRERIEHLELTAAQTEESKNETHRRSEALQNELSDLRRALEQKDASLAQQEAEFRESSDRLNAQLSAFQSQLAEKQQLLDKKDGELGHAGGQIAGLGERIAQMESLHAAAQSAAASEVECVRQESLREVTALEAILREKEQALQQHQTAIVEFEANLNGQIQDLKNQLTQKQELLDRRDQEFQTIGSETAVLRNRVAQLESTASQAEMFATAEIERIRGELQRELAALQAQLAEKEHGLAESQSLVRESEGRLQAQIHDLEIQITEKQLLLETRNVEIVGLRNKLTAVSERLAQLETGQHEATAAASNAELARQRFEAELAARQEELRNLERLLADREAQSYDLQQTFTAQLRDLQNQLAEKQGLLETRSQEISELTARTNDLQEQITCLELTNRQTVKEAQAAARALEDGLQARFREIEAAVSEKAQLLQDRTAELESAQSETALLRERIEHLELTAAQTEESKNETHRRSEALQNELSDLRRALEQKDASLAQQEAEFRESSDRLNVQLSALQSQLAEERGLVENQQHELQSARFEITALKDRVHELESAKTAAETTAAVDIEHFKQQYQLELAGLRADLEARQLALEEQQTSARALDERLNGDIHRLVAQLAEKQTLLDRGDAELQESRSEISALREEIARSDLARRQTEMLAATQAEQIRERVKAEVGALDSQLREKESALTILADRTRELESIFNARIDDLQSQVAEKQSVIESREIEMTALQTQISGLLAQVSHLERANGQALEQQRVAASGLEQSLRNQVTELQTQLAEKLAALESRNDEIQALESKITGLVERADQAEVTLKQAEATAMTEVEQMRRQAEAELAAQRAEADQRVEALQKREAALDAAEKHRQQEINMMRAEVAEKHSLLENRNNELLRVKTEMDTLQERIAYLNSVAKQVELESFKEAEPAGKQSTIELDRLRNEEGQKERILQERQAAVNDLDEGFQAQIDSLRSELAEKQALLENPSQGFLLGDPTLTESQKEKLTRLEQLVETIKADNEQTLSPNNRRWRFSLGRKRRWRS
jgi:chromosome segregation ATPase